MRKEMWVRRTLFVLIPRLDGHTHKDIITRLLPVHFRSNFGPTITSYCIKQSAVNLKTIFIYRYGPYDMSHITWMVSYSSWRIIEQQNQKRQKWTQLLITNNQHSKSEHGVNELNCSDPYQ